MRLLLAVSYLSILTVIYGGLSSGTAAIILVAIVLAQAAADYRTFILAPFLLYPFMFLVRIPDPSSVLLVTISDLAAILSISVYFVISQPRRSPGMNVTLITLLLLIYATYSLLNPAIHVFEVRLVPAVFRQYVLPIVFVAAFASACYRDETLSQRALVISVLSFAIVGSIALLNYTGIVRIPPLFEEIFPYSSFSVDGDKSVVGRGVLGLALVPRLNLFVGGALGSAAAIFVTLALLLFFGFVKRIAQPVAIAIGAVLTISAAMTISFSTLYPIAVLLVFYILRRGNVITFIASAWAVGFLLLSSSLFGRSAYEYFTSEIVSNVSDTAQSMTWPTFIFGMGPRLTAKNFASAPVSLSGDIGILRVFVESGIVNFLLFAMIIVLIIRRGVTRLRKELDREIVPFLLIVVVMLSQVHANLTALPPFYPLFALAVAGVLVTPQSEFTASDQREV